MYIRLFLCSLVTTAIFSASIDQFELLVKQYVGVEKTDSLVSLAQIADSYGKLKGRLDHLLADQTLRVFLKKSISQIRQEVAREKVKQKRSKKSKA